MDRAVTDIIHPVACGLDVHLVVVAACLARSGPKGSPVYEERSFPTTRRGLRELRDWLRRRSQVVVAQVDYTAEPPTITYRALSREGRVRALARAPRKEHPGKCMVKKADLQVVTDLMELFEF